MTDTSSIWLRKQRGARGPSSRLNRSELASAAIGLADRHGLAAVTMRSLAHAMGTAPASLYRAVRSRNELVELMVDHVIGEFTYRPTLVGSGAHGLMELSGQARAIYRRHPWMTEAHASQAVLGPNAITYLDWALATLTGSTLQSQQKLEAVGVLSALVRMLVANELEDARASRASRDWQAATAAHLTAKTQDGQHPHLASVLAAAAAEPHHANDLFDRVVQRAITGLLGAT